MTNYASQPIIFVLVTVVSFFQFALILRLIFEIMRVNFYNPVCQIIVRLTDPMLKPLSFIPLYVGRINLILIILVTAVTAFKIYLPYMSTGFEFSLNTLIVASFGKFLDETFTIIWWCVIIGAIGSWFMAYNSHPIFTLIDEICEPLYRPIRNIIPATSGIDFSPIILLVIIQVLQMVIIPPIFQLANQL